MSTFVIQLIALCLIAACWMGILGIAGAIGFGLWKAWQCFAKPFDYPPTRFM